MAKLTKDEVLHVAKLAKLNLTEKEIEKFTPQLANVVEFIGHLDEVDTKNSEPTSQTTGLENVKRDDVYKTDEVLTQDESLSGSDKTHNGYFKVDAVLSERTDK